MPYALGAVKPHVKTAAEQIGARFNVATIYGWAPGKYDHPKGLALDFMMGKDRAKGDALSAYVVANASALAVTYVIWYGKIWSAARASEGWRVYHPPAGEGMHYDHVHVSFSPTPGSGVELAGYPGATTMGNSDLSGMFDAFEKMLGYMTKKEYWYRYWLAIGGMVLIFVALAKMTGTTKLLPAGKVGKVLNTVKGMKG